MRVRYGGFGISGCCWIFNQIVPPLPAPAWPDHPLLSLGSGAWPGSGACHTRRGEVRCDNPEGAGFEDERSGFLISGPGGPKGGSAVRMRAGLPKTGKTGSR